MTMMDFSPSWTGPGRIGNPGVSDSWKQYTKMEWEDEAPGVPDGPDETGRDGD